MNDQTHPVPLDPPGIRTVATAVADQVGLDPTGAQIIKFTNNAVVRLPHAGAVIRIAGSPAVRRRVDVVLAAATLYIEYGIHAVALHPHATEPVNALGHVATVWIDAHDDHAPNPTPADMAEALRAIHAIDERPPGIPAWDPLTSIRRRIAAADGADDADLTFLADACDELEVPLKATRELSPLLPPGVIHGDAFLGNLIPSRPHPLICDFDATAIGPREWDLTPIAVGSLRMNYPAALHRDFVTAYGADMTNWEGFSTFRRIRELQLVTSVLPALNANPALRAEWQHRLDTLKTDDTDTRWEPYPHS